MYVYAMCVCTRHSSPSLVIPQYSCAVPFLTSSSHHSLKLPSFGPDARMCTIRFSLTLIATASLALIFSVLIYALLMWPSLLVTARLASKIGLIRLVQFSIAIVRRRERRRAQWRRRHELVLVLVKLLLRNTNLVKLVNVLFADDECEVHSLLDINLRDRSKLAFAKSFE